MWPHVHEPVLSEPPPHGAPGADDVHAVRPHSVADGRAAQTHEGDARLAGGNGAGWSGVLSGGGGRVPLKYHSAYIFPNKLDRCGVLDVRMWRAFLGSLRP